MAMCRKFLPLVPLLLLLSVTFSQGQDDPGPDNTDQSFERDSIPELDLDKTMADEKVEPKKKKRKKKVFYGMKTRRAFTRKGMANRQEIEMFYYLKKHKDPDFYVQDIFVFDIEKQKVVEINKKEKMDPSIHKVLHGPYKRTIGGQIVEQGIYYVGTKHGRWEEFSREKTDEYNGEEVTYNILLDKTKYYKGWPREAKISYYDGAHTKVKEVYPYVNGKLHGNYYYFLENGQVFIRGKYMDGKKIGLWIEYFKDRERKRKEIKYPDTPYDEAEPVVLSEWDEKNNLIIRNGEKVEPGDEVEMDPLKRRFLKQKRH